MLAGRARTSLERALLRVATRALEIELGALTATDATDGFGVTGHGVRSRSDAAPLRGAAAVVGDWCYVGDRRDLEAGRLEGPDRLLAAGTGTLDVNLDLAHAVLHGASGGAIGGQGRGVRRALAGALEAGNAGRAPADHGAGLVGDRDDRVVERRLNVNVTLGNVLLLAAPLLVGP